MRSEALGVTIGIERVNSIRIGTTRAPEAKITSGLSSTRFAAVERTKSMLSLVQRSSNWALTLAAQPRFRSSSRKARTRACISAFIGGYGLRNSIPRIPPPFGARAASGHAAAAPPRSVMKSRRFRSSIQLPPQGPPRKNCASLRSNSNGFDHARPFFDLALGEFLQILGGPAVGGDKRIA